MVRLLGTVVVLVVVACALSGMPFLPPCYLGKLYPHLAI